MPRYTVTIKYIKTEDIEVEAPDEVDCRDFVKKYYTAEIVEIKKQ